MTTSFSSYRFVANVGVVDKLTCTALPICGGELRKVALIESRPVVDNDCGQEQPEGEDSGDDCEKNVGCFASFEGDGEVVWAEHDLIDAHIQ